MNALKEATIATIKKLPDNCTIDDIMYEIDFVAQVYEGLDDANSGKVITTEELLEKVKTWGR
jgi:hypothetical protein